MKYLKKNKDFINTKNIFINENLNINKYHNTYNKIIKELHLNFYFFTTYGTMIPIFFPIFENLIKNQKLEIKFNKVDIVLLSIYTIAVLINENKNEIVKIKNILIEKGFSEILDKSVNFLKSINNLFIAIAKNMGKIIVEFVSMLSYISLYTPFLIAILDLIKLYNINFETFNDIETTTMGFSMSLGIGIITISIKHFLNMILKKMNRLIKKNNIQENIQEKLSIEKIYELLISK